MERINVAKSIASAVAYLHSEQIIYRDLKPENIGFDREGNVKIFDFGLAKRLLPDDKVSNGTYRLTGNTGSLRYMAPEVALNQNYNLTADSYSYAIVFWQICSLTVPYAGYNVRMHADLVVGKGNRPKIERSWPYEWSLLMTTCWSTVASERLGFDEILEQMEDEYDKLVHRANARDSDAAEIRAKRKNKKKDGNDESAALKLDVDTRKANFEEAVWDDRHVEGDIV